MKKLFFNREGLRDSSDGFVDLKHAEYKILCFLSKNKERLVSIQHLSERTGYSHSYIQKIIFNLRKKTRYLSYYRGARLSNFRMICTDDTEEDYIKNHSSRGYICAQIEHLDEDGFRYTLDDVCSLQISLTSGQKKIFDALATPDYIHMTERELAIRLGFNLDNFKYHRKKMYKAIGAVSRTHATQIAVQFYSQREAE